MECLSKLVQFYNYAYPYSRIQNKNYLIILDKEAKVTYSMVELALEADLGLNLDSAVVWFLY